jgi:hypothetical protein
MTTRDKETTSTSIEIDNLMMSREQGSVGEYRQKTVDRLFSSLLNARLSELAQKPDPPFVMASVGRGGFIARTKDEAFLSAVVKDDGVERGIDALVAEPSGCRDTASPPRSRPSEAGRAAELRASGRRNEQPRVSSRADEHSQLPGGRDVPTAGDEFALHHKPCRRSP